ncbi:MAG: hypothetical protein FK733_00680 [Asgard group archaeon]|nr:hypothetical protein [Asgard group archaeon]
MKVWAEVKFNFVYFDKVPDIDWDKEIRETIPRALDTKTIEEFYQELQKVVAKLRDGHTFIMQPFAEMQALERPPLEFQMIEEKIIITRVGNSEEILKYKITPGLEIIEVNGVPAKDYLNDNILSYYLGNTKHWGITYGLYKLLEGKKDTKVTIKVSDFAGKINSVILTRNSELKDGSIFKYSYFDWEPLIIKQVYEKDILYLKLSTFIFNQIVDEFYSILDKIDFSKIKGMILDIRSNTGGNSANSYQIISHLIDKPIEAEKWKTRKYLPAFRSWGKPEEWFKVNSEPIKPSKKKRFLGPLVILTGNATASAAEDFVVPLKYAKRATLIGNTTAGTTGNPINIVLPGGYFFSVCTKISTYPNEEEFVGIGIPPDIEVKLTRDAFIDKKDIVLEKAIKVLKNEIK